MHVTQVICAEPFSEVQHTGENIARSVKQQLAAFGIGAYDPSAKVDTVGEEIHGVCTDQGSNMVAGFRDFEGGACACHRLSNALKVAFALDAVQGVIKKASFLFVLVACQHRNLIACCQCR